MRAKFWIRSSLLVSLTVPLLPAQQAAPARLGLSDFSASLEALSTRVRPAVVQIFSTGFVPVSEDNDSNDTGALISRQQATGSGVILSADGYIITNYHVVKGGREIQVKLALKPEHPTERLMVAPEGMTMDAKLVGFDRESDLALLKIPRTGLPFLALGDSDTLRQGQLVLAFGNPLGLEGSVSMGVVSSVSRQIKPDESNVYVQTDAPINPGNSGGPLVDADAKVMGINTFILTQSGGSEGLGFAIPSNVVRNIYQQLREAGHVHRGQIGVFVQDINPLLARGLKLPRDWGVIVSDVVADGPADKAGLKVGDILVALNGRRLESALQLRVGIERQPVGDNKVTLEVLRGSQTLSLSVAVEERKDDPMRFADMVNPQDNLVNRLGVLAIPLSDKLADLLPELRHDYGLIVAARTPAPPYSGDELETGDVIYAIGVMPTPSIATLRDALNALKKGDAAVLQVERKSRLMYLAIQME